MVKSRIDDYLEFDSDELFQIPDNLIRIFGGAVRDSICDDPINDVDILCSTRGSKFLSTLLESKGYHHFDKLSGKEISSMYSDIHVIFEPHTWIKNKKVIQLIRRSVNLNESDIHTYLNTRQKEEMKYLLYRNGFIDLIKNVDLSCCGVSYDKNGLHENFKNAVMHCKYKMFLSNKYGKMYTEKRAISRKIKLQSRGWKEIYSDIDKRDLKIKYMIDEQPDISFIKEYK